MNNLKNISFFLLFLLLHLSCNTKSEAFSETNISGPSKKYDSYKGLVMAGYQGWFTTPEDGSNRGWYHYQGKNGFKPGSASVDLWPEVSEYKKTYPTEFQFKDGNPAHVFSSYDYSTVDLHFQWMKEYGIDGAFMQRFVSEVKNPKGKNQFNKVLDSAIKAAASHSRAVCVMYDLSGMKPNDASFILEDMSGLAEMYGLHTRQKAPTYLFHNGKPLVTLWGVGFNDKRAYGLDDIKPIVSGLKEMGFSIMLGVPTYWRSLGSDAVRDPELHSLIKECDIIMPWFVGRYNEESFDKFLPLIDGDMEWCKTNGVDYVPLAYPGFSWINMKGENSFHIPRNQGSFFWKQLSTYLEKGAEMIYIAMFDEIDEGTAIFKCEKDVPVGSSRFVAIEEGIEPDHYLWLTGKAAQILRKESSLSKNMPRREELSSLSTKE